MLMLKFQRVCLCFEILTFLAFHIGTLFDDDPKNNQVSRNGGPRSPACCDTMRSSNPGGERRGGGAVRTNPIQVPSPCEVHFCISGEGGHSEIGHISLTR